MTMKYGTWKTAFMLVETFPKYIHQCPCIKLIWRQKASCIERRRQNVRQVACVLVTLAEGQHPVDR